ncbi:MAG: response regulator [Candidatus Omnitrophica bacterium]|nr:response regulator [Candidatus Omnitrophota bacterium]MCM8811340.1 response regulator [Candidatus Omnitrophota bacterium]
MRKFYTTGQLGKLLGISRITVYKWVKNRKIQGVKLPGGRWVIFKKEVERLIKERNLKELGIENEIKILIADDNVDMANSLKEFLENRNINFKVITAHNGFEVGKYLYSFMPNILILDIFMPGLSGFDILNIIKKDEELKDTIIIVITGYPEKENIKRAKEHGADYIFIKPFDYNEIEKTIKNIIKI